MTDNSEGMSLDGVELWSANEVESFLKEHGGDPTKCVTIQGRETSVLHHLCMHDEQSLVELCFKIKGKEMDVETKEPFTGHTILHHACYGDEPCELVRFLVEHAKCNVEARSNHMRTPLHIAAWFCDMDVIRYLVEEAGAKVNVKDNGQQTPLLTAMKSHHNTDHCILYLAERSQIDSRALYEAWESNCTWRCKQSLLNMYARSELELSEDYISKYQLHTVLRIPLLPTKAYSEVIGRSACITACVLDPNGRLPLHIALCSPSVRAGLVADPFVYMLPRCATVRDAVTGLYPFEAAACRTVDLNHDDNEEEEEEEKRIEELGLVYVLFRYDPQHFLSTRCLGLNHTYGSERRVRQKTMHNSFW